MQSEPINFMGIAKILGRYCRDPEFLDEVSKCREMWLNPPVPMIGWHNRFSADDVLDAYFNEEVFHLGSSKLVSLGEVRQKLTERAILFYSFDVVQLRLLAVRNLNWMIQPFLNGKQYFRIPAS